MSRLTASRAAFDLIASFEGFRTRAALAPNGRWTLGFGHTATAREGLSVTRAEAEDLLRWDLLPIEDAIRQIALTPLSQNQFDALVSFAFNIGLENFKSSDVLKFLNQGQPVAAALSMHAWRRAPVNGRVLTIDALVRRRAAESALFLETIGPRPAAPTSVIRPQIDFSAALLSHAPDTTKVDMTALDTLDRETDVSPEDTEPGAENDDGETIKTPEEDTAIDVTPIISVPETNPREVLVSGPVVTPAPIIPPMSELPKADVSSKSLTGPPMGEGPMIPDGLAPFPGSPVYAPANGTGEFVSEPANDESQTRLHGVPELIETPGPSQPAPAKVTEPTSGFSTLVLVLMAIGALLLAFGLYFSWQSGIFSVTTPRREPTANELTALLAAAIGLIMLVSSTVSAFTSEQSRD